MTQDELKALIEDLRLNHEYCPKEVILQAADELERLVQRTWVDLTDEEIDNINYTSAHMLAREVLAKFKEKNT